MKTQQNGHQNPYHEYIDTHNDVEDEIGQLTAKIEQSQSNDNRNESKQTENKDTCYKYKEVFVVSFADTSTKPWTVMIESFNTCVAFIAVRGTRGSVYETSIAEFNFQIMSFDGHTINFCDIDHLTSLVSLTDRQMPQFFILEICQYFQNHTRICKAENKKKNLGGNVAYDHQNTQPKWSQKSCNNVEDQCSHPEQQMGEGVVFGL